MRIIKFRAKFGGCWRYGQYVHTGIKLSLPLDEDSTAHILVVDKNGIRFLRVTDIKTIGQFSGLYDNKGREIYEGDILRIYDFTNVVCEFRHGAFGYIYRNEFHSFAGNINYTFNPKNTDKEFEVIGNIYDNPELLKEELY